MLKYAEMLKENPSLLSVLAHAKNGKMPLQTGEK